MTHRTHCLTLVQAATLGLLTACTAPPLSSEADLASETTSAGVGGQASIDLQGGSPTTGIGLRGEPLDVIEPAPLWADARPLDSGTLATSPDGQHAVVTDEAHDAVFLIELPGLEKTQLDLTPGDGPSRVVLSDEHAFLTLRGNAVAQIQLAAPHTISRFSTCSSPQGIAAEQGKLHVACRDGSLQTLSANDGALERTLTLDSDLRDVLVVPTGLLVTRFASAELMWLDGAGKILHRHTPPAEPGNISGSAWKTILSPGGQLIVAHQSTTEAPLTDGYSSGDCSSAAAPTLTAFDLPAPGEEFNPPQLRSQRTLVGSAGTLDITATPDEIILAVPGNEFARRFFAERQDADAPSEGLVDLNPQQTSHPILHFALADDGSTCVSGGDFSQPEPDVPLGVSTLLSGPYAGTIVLATQSPAKLKLLGTGLEVTLTEQDRRNSGLELFQMSVGSGISCASCHPRGRSDARTWGLPRGPRRTQSLEGGVSSLGAFHWDGEFSTFSSLVDDVMTGRMGLGVRLGDETKAALLTFLDDVPPAEQQLVANTSLVQQGQDLFWGKAAACSNCHNGESFSDGEIYDVGTGGRFVTPPLTGVGYRTPLLHDGCADTLEERFGPCGGGDLHGRTAQLSTDDIAALVAYMKTL